MAGITFIPPAGTVTPVPRPEKLVLLPTVCDRSSHTVGVGGVCYRFAHTY